MRVLLSVGGFGPAQLTCEILANAMHFTRASGAVLHLSRGAPAYRCCDARVLLNPVQHASVRHGSFVLNLHLSNIALLLATFLPGATDRIVIVPGNAAFYADCTPHLTRYANSFTPGALDEQHPLDAAQVARVVRTAQDSAIRTNGFFKGFVRYASSNHSRVVRPSPLAYMPHEGSFYSARMLRALAAILRTSEFGGNAACPFAGSCTLEETVLPSLLWQNYPDAAVAGGNVLVHRYLGWATHNVSSTVRLTDGFADAPCGIKLVHDDGERHTLGVLRKLRDQARYRLHTDACNHSRVFMRVF
tara:strand:- start:2400 stop:3308 length:909 start_codon:yes stop_codon:yes gene_type:complete